MRSLSYENEFSLTCKKKSFSCDRCCTNPRSVTAEVKDNCEMVHFLSLSPKSKPRLPVGRYLTYRNGFHYQRKHFLTFQHSVCGMRDGTNRREASIALVRSRRRHFGHVSQSPQLKLGVVRSEPEKSVDCVADGILVKESINK